MSTDERITPEELAAHERELAEAHAEEDREEQERLQAIVDEHYEDPHDALVEEAWEPWRPVATDLLAVDTNTPIRWVPGAERIVRRGERQSWVASYGEGKTQAALHLTAQICEAGGRVVYIDAENDPREMAERLQPITQAFGREAQLAVSERLLYMPGLDLAAVLSSPEIGKAFVAAVAPVDLLIIDSWTRVLATLGYDEDSNRDITAFMRIIVDPMAAHGIAVLILDNTGHEGTRARGAISKAATVEAVYAVSGGKAVTPAEAGTLHLKRTRSRSGRIAKYVKAGSGGGEFTRLEPQEGDAPAGTALALQTARRDAIRTRVGADWTSLADLGTSFAEALEPPSADTLRRDLRALVEEEKLELWCEALGPKPGKGAHWRTRS